MTVDSRIVEAVRVGTVQLNMQFILKSATVRQQRSTMCCIFQSWPAIYFP